MNDEYLIFETDRGATAYTVEGDCCSRSYFHDFIGVKKLLENGPVIEASEVKDDSLPTELAGPEEQDGDRYEDEYIQVYGYRLVTEHPLFGEQTSVFAFRNASNGYYGGWMFDAEVPADEIPEILDDVLGD